MKTGTEKNVKQLSEIFGHNITPSQLSFYSKEIDDLKIDNKKKLQAFRDAPRLFDRFPSIKQLRELITAGVAYEEEAIKKHNEFRVQWAKEETRYAKIKKEFLKVVTQEDINKYVFIWFSECFGKKTVENIGEFGLNLKLFEKQALFDLADCNMDSKKAFQLGKRNAQAARERVKKLSKIDMKRAI